MIVLELDLETARVVYAALKTRLRSMDRNSEPALAIERAAVSLKNTISSEASNLAPMRPTELF